MNTIELSSIYQKELDRTLVAGSTSGWMELNDKLVKYNGGNEIKIADIVMDGLGDYDREKGFPAGSLNLSFSTYKMTMDRGRTFQLDAMDVDESNFIATSGTVLKEFQTTKVIPEIDAYRYSKIAQLVKSGATSEHYHAADLNTGNVYKWLCNDISIVQDAIGSEIPLVISIARTVADLLFRTADISRNISLTDFTKGEINTQVKSIDGIPIILVPSGRMMTKYTFYSGKDDQVSGGFKAAEDAEQINWIIMPREAPIAVSKQDNMRIFEPQDNINADAWKIDYRRYHDLWVPTNKLSNIIVCTAEKGKE